MVNKGSDSDGDKGDAKAKGATGDGDTDWEARYKGEQRRSDQLEKDLGVARAAASNVSGLSGKLDNLNTSFGSLKKRVDGSELTTALAADEAAAARDDDDQPNRESAADKVRKSQSDATERERQALAANTAFSDIARYVDDIGPSFDRQDPEIQRAVSLYDQGRDEGNQDKLNQAVEIVRTVSRREPSTQTPPPDANANAKGAEGAGNDASGDESNNNDESGDDPPAKSKREEIRDAGLAAAQNSKGKAAGDESWKDQIGNTKNPNPLALFTEHHAEEAAADS